MNREDEARPLNRATRTDVVTKSRTTLYFLQQMFATIKNLICSKTGLMWVVKRTTSLFNSFCSNVAKQVARFCCTFYHRVKGAVSRQSSSFCLILPITRSIAMELKVSKEITGKLQNQRSETNKYVS